MKYIVYALAMFVLAGSSCKSKSEPEPEIVKESPAPENPSKPSDQHPTDPGNPHSDHCEHHSDHCDHHHSDHCDKCHKHKHKHKKIPPGHAKKMHGEQSARNYAPGHHKKH